jgi:hypothetical protein
MRTSTSILACALVLAAAVSLRAGPSTPAPLSSESAWRASDASQLRRARLVRIDDTPRQQKSDAPQAAHALTGLLLLLLSGLGLWIAGRGIGPARPGEAFAKFGSELRAISTN